jgi:hypothetical protein
MVGEVQSILSSRPDLVGLASAVGALSTAIRLGVVAFFAWWIRSSRSQDWSTPARRHFDFTLALLFFLMVSQTLWEHYLSLLFPFLAYAVATRGSFSPSGRALLVAIFALTMGQNLILMLFLRDHFSFESAAAIMGISLFKSGPLLLTAVLLIRHRGEIFAGHRAPGWRDATPSDANRSHPVEMS